MKLGTIVAGTVPTAAEWNAGAAAWATWSPTYASLTIGNGTVVAKYGFFGRTVFLQWNFVLGSTSSVGSAPTVSLPVATAAGGTALLVGETAYYDTSATTVYSGQTNGASPFTLFTWTVSGANIVRGSVSSTSPFTWATGDVMSVYLVYEGTS